MDLAFFCYSIPPARATAGARFHFFISVDLYIPLFFLVLCYSRENEMIEF